MGAFINITKREVKPMPQSYDIVLQVLERLREDWRAQSAAHAAALAEMAGDVKAVWDEAKKTNGRVNGHDVELARIGERLEGIGDGRRKMWVIFGWMAAFTSGVGVTILSHWLK